MALGLLVFVQIVLLIALGSFIAWWIRYIFSAQSEVPYVPTPYAVLPRINEELNIEAGETVYELGSGDGRFILYCARQEPHARYVGIERNRLLHLIAQIQKHLRGNPQNVSFARADFYTYDLAKADKIYAYLLDSMMDRLLPTLERGFRGRLVSRAFRFKNKPHRRQVSLASHPGIHRQNILYVYDF
jgi:hypothetical protein